MYIFLFFSLIAQVHRGQTLPESEYLLSVCVLDNSDISDLYAQNLTLSQAFLSIQEVLRHMKPQLRLLPSQDSMYKIESDLVKAHLFMQALREIGAQILEPRHEGNDYTVQQARKLFAASRKKNQPAPGYIAPKTSHISPKTNHISKNTSHISPKTNHISKNHTSSNTGHISPKANHISPKMSHISPNTSHISLKNSNISPKMSTQSSPRSPRKLSPRVQSPRMSSLRKSPHAANHSYDIDEREERYRPDERPKPIQLYEETQDQTIRRPRRGKHDFSYRNQRYDKMEEEEEEEIVFSLQEIDKDMFHIPYNIKYCLNDKEDSDHNYYTKEQVHFIIEAINVTRSGQKQHTYMNNHPDEKGYDDYHKEKDYHGYTNEKKYHSMSDHPEERDQFVGQDSDKGHLTRMGQHTDMAHHTDIGHSSNMDQYRKMVESPQSYVGHGSQSPGEETCQKYEELQYESDSDDNNYRKKSSEKRYDMFHQDEEPVSKYSRQNQYDRHPTSRPKFNPEGGDKNSEHFATSKNFYKRNYKSTFH